MLWLTPLGFWLNGAGWFRAADALPSDGFHFPFGVEFLTFHVNCLEYDPRS